jgi:hypothetical protein
MHVTTATKFKKGVKRFGIKKKEPIEFYIGDNLYIAVPKVPAQTMIDLLGSNEELRNVDGRRGAAQFELAMNMFETILFDESYELLREKMKDKEDPVDIKDLTDVMQWLIGEAYGLRPTQEPSRSGEPSENGGTSSTAGAPLEESTLDDFLGPDASTSGTSGSSTD